MNNVLKYGIYGLLAMICIVPFANPIAYAPMGKFYSEAIALVGAILVFSLFVFRVKEIKITPFAIGSFLFAGFVLVQPLLINMTFSGNVQYVALQFVILSLFSIAITSMAEESAESRDTLLSVICWSLMVSAAIQAVIAFFQGMDMSQALGAWALPGGSGAGRSQIYGNIGQRNQFTDFISVGMMAALYLFHTKKINKYVLGTYGALFLGVITFAAGRSVLLVYVLIMLISGILVLVNKKDESRHAEFKKIFLLTVSVFVALLVIEFILPKVMSFLLSQGGSNAANTATAADTSGLSRMSSIDQTTYRRFYEWQKAGLLFLTHPLIGIGWYQYPAAGINLMMNSHFMIIPKNFALYTHCHNSLMNMLAETGIIGTGLIVFYGVLYTMYTMCRRVSPSYVLVMFMAVPILVHSFFEYPLWYAYFTVLLALILSFAPSKYTFKKVGINLKIVGAVIACGLLSFAYVANQYNNQLMQLASAPSDFDDYSSNVKQLETIVDANNMFSMQAVMVLDSYIMPGNQATNQVMSVEEQLKYTTMLFDTLPYPGAIFKEAILYKAAGNNAKALETIDLLAHAYPAYKDQFAQQLMGMNMSDLAMPLMSYQYEDKSWLTRVLQPILSK